MRKKEKCSATLALIRDAVSAARISINSTNPGHWEDCDSLARLFGTDIIGVVF
jgi:hypothetical protein